MSELGFALIGLGAGIFVGHFTGYARAMRARLPQYRRNVGAPE